MTSAAAASARAGDGVGEVTFVIGVAHRIDAGGTAAPVARGMRVNVTDRIETEAGGHVHVRFVDGAFIAVRPSSRLRVDEYRVDSAKPQENAVRFTLERGVSRSVTGDAARVAKDRFRLNTPIAAIGVRGTDFVTLAQRDTVRATVNSGAVVLAPFGQGCAADALGPCATSSALTLSADMGRQMLEYRRLAAAPKLVPAGREQVAPDAGAPSVPQDAHDNVRVAASENHASTVVATAPTSNPKPPPPVTPPPEQTGPASLVWGRYASAPLPGDTMSVTYASARPGHEATVGDNYYLLLRRATGEQVLASNLGRVDFSLKSAQATFTDGNGAKSAANVGNGWLRIDFDQLLFATGLELSHEIGGAAVLNANGRLRDDGIFSAVNDTGRVAGATSLDGKDAAYLFERFVPRGIFSGITLWRR